ARLQLEVGVEVRGALLAPDPGGLEAAERRRGVAGTPGVDVDVARVEHRRELVGVRDVARPYSRGEAVLGVVGARRDLLEVVERHRDEHRAEDLLAGDRHLVVDAGEQRRLDEVPVAVAAVTGTWPAADDDLCARLAAGVD